MDKKNTEKALAKRFWIRCVALWVFVTPVITAVLVGRGSWPCFFALPFAAIVGFVGAALVASCFFSHGLTFVGENQEAAYIQDAYCAVHDRYWLDDSTDPANPMNPLSPSYLGRYALSWDPSE